METDVMLTAFIVIALGVVGLTILIYRLESTPINLEIGGIWLNESMNIRILLHDVDSVFQGSVIWANGMDKILGFKVVENLRFDRSKKGKGKYSDPITGQQFEINMRLKRKGLISISAYHPDSESLVFSQEWKLYVS
jgi:hypothetical protein